MMEMLMELMLYLGPVAVIICAICAVRGTRIRRDRDIPVDLLGIANSVMDTTNTERKWGL